MLADSEVPPQLKSDIQMFIYGINEDEMVSDDINNAALCRCLKEIFLEK